VDAKGPVPNGNSEKAAPVGRQAPGAGRWPLILWALAAAMAVALGALVLFVSRSPRQGAQGKAPAAAGGPEKGEPPGPGQPSQATPPKEAGPAKPAAEPSGQSPEEAPGPPPPESPRPAEPETPAAPKGGPGVKEAAPAEPVPAKGEKPAPAPDGTKAPAETPAPPEMPAQPRASLAAYWKAFDARIRPLLLARRYREATEALTAMAQEADWAVAKPLADHDIEAVGKLAAFWDAAADRVAALAKTGPIYVAGLPRKPTDYRDGTIFYKNEAGDRRVALADLKAEDLLRTVGSLPKASAEALAGLKLFAAYAKQGLPKRADGALDLPLAEEAKAPAEAQEEAPLPRGPYGSRSALARSRFIGGPGGTTEQAESAVAAGLIWLAKAQDRDGHWDCRFWDGGGNYDVGMTGLALLAFEGAGYTHTKGRYRDTVSRGLDWLRYNQKPNGAFGYQTFYEQGIAAMAVSEAYGLTRAETVRNMAQKAVDFIVQTQPDHGGFRYQGAVDKENGDMSVTGWQIMAMKSAICSELNVPMQAIDRSREFLKNTLREYGGSSYTVGTPNATPAMSAIGMLCRQFIGGNYDAEINAAANHLLEQQKKAVAAAGGGGGQKDALVHDLYYTYYSVLAMFQMGGEYWTQWNKMFRDPLVKLQETKNILDGKGRFVRGSWDPKDTMWGAQGGRVYSTAMAILSLEVYYRFLPVYKK